MISGRKHKVLNRESLIQAGAHIYLLLALLALLALIRIWGLSQFYMTDNRRRVKAIQEGVRPSPSRLPCHLQEAGCFTNLFLKCGTILWEQKKVTDAAVILAG